MTSEDELISTPIPETLKQEEQLQDFLSNDGQWRDVYLSEGIEGRSLYAAFSPARMRHSVLQRPEWDSVIGDGLPHFSLDSKDRVKFCRHGSYRDEVFPVVIILENHGIGDTPLPEIVEEFRHLMNLLPNREHTEYHKVQADGTVETVARVSQNRVSILTKYLRRYQAARQLDLVLYISSQSTEPRNHTQGFVRTFGDDAHEITGHDHRLRLWSSYFSSSTSTTLMGKKVVPPPAQELSGIFPWEEDESEDYLEFQIGEDELGEPIMHTCDPDQLGNYFGANPDAPQYVTPVWFRGEVLQKYYADTQKYTITDGDLSCGSLWGVRIDNDNEHGDVMVWLGDLGRDIPASERHHWKSHNIFRPEWGSEAAFRRGILGEWADTDSPVFKLKQEFERFGVAWRERFGWDLFRKLEGKNRESLDRLRTPLNDSDREFEDIVKDLHIVLVESLNQEKLKQIAAGDTKHKKSIALLSQYLEEQRYANRESDIRLLQRLNEIRNKTSHFRGGEEEKRLRELGVGDDRIGTMHELFTSAATMLESLRDFLPEIVSD